MKSVGTSFFSIFNVKYKDWTAMSCCRRHIQTSQPANRFFSNESVLRADLLGLILLKVSNFFFSILALKYEETNF